MPQNEKKDTMQKIETITRIGNLVLGATFTMIQIYLTVRTKPNE